VGPEGGRGLQGLETRAAELYGVAGRLRPMRQHFGGIRVVLDDQDFERPHGSPFSTKKPGSVGGRCRVETTWSSLNRRPQRVNPAARGGAPSCGAWAAPLRLRPATPQIVDALNDEVKHGRQENAEQR